MRESNRHAEWCKNKDNHLTMRESFAILQEGKRLADKILNPVRQTKLTEFY